MASYEKLKNNSWSVRFRIVDPSGKLVNKRLSGFVKKGEAERAYREYMAIQKPNARRVLAQLCVPKSAPDFAFVFSSFLDYLSHRVKEGTIYDLSTTFTKRVIPFFGDKPIDKITSIEIMDWQTALNKEGLSFAYKEKQLRYINATFKYAVKYYGLAVNPCDNVDKFQRVAQKKEMQIWSEQEFYRFLNCVDDSTYYTFFATLYYTGCRVGELLALFWEDIDWANQTIDIKKSITRKIASQPYAITSPKNLSSYRKIKLPSQCMQLLNTLYDTTSKLGHFVFNGSRPLAETSYKRYYQATCAKAGVKQIRIHDFRHSHASLLIAKGENILLIAKRLGHSNIEQTLNTYSHLMPNAENELISKLENSNYTLNLTQPPKA